MKYKSFLTLIIAIIIPSVATTAKSEETIEGTLKFLKTNNGETFLAIDSTKKVVTKNDQDIAAQSKQVQVAGLSQEQWKDAMSLIDKPVVCTGRLMGAMTVHHHTPVLIISSSLKQNDGEAQKESPSDNPPQKRQKPVLDPSPNDNNQEKPSEENTHSKEWER